MTGWETDGWGMDRGLVDRKVDDGLVDGIRGGGLEWRIAGGLMESSRWGMVING